MPDIQGVMQRLEANGVECYSRNDWGTVRPQAYIDRRQTHPMPNGPADYHFVHITVTADTDTVQEGKAGARQVEGYGLSTPPMVSYQDLVTNEGKYFRGQDYGTKGTHTVNDKDVPGFPYDLNLVGYATAIMQNVEHAVTDKQIKVVAATLAAREIEGWVRKGAPVYGHRKFAYKLCPGDKMFEVLDRVERLKNNYVADGIPNLGDSVVRLASADPVPAEPTNRPEKPEPTRGKNVEVALKALRKAHDPESETHRAAMIRAAIKVLRQIEPLS